jgi:hypothetical protein
MNANHAPLQSGNRTLSSAKAGKQDKFYTQLNDLSRIRKFLMGERAGTRTEGIARSDLRSSAGARMETPRWKT